ncbi:MAG: ABC transporter substrate-binding protein [Candidatus Limnocylindrales bacterium]
MSRTLRLATLAVGAVLIASACSSGGTATPTTAPSTTAPSGTATATPTTAPSASPTTTAITVPTGELLFPTKLVICSDIPYPPQEFFTPDGQPTGSDIEIGQEIAKRLGLTAEIQNSVFDTIIAALLGGKCDIIISAQNITPDRVKQVDMIPYFQAGQSFVVAKGNPSSIKSTDDLCGKSIAAETGTTEVDYLQGTGDYKGQGLSQACTTKGLAAIDIKKFPKDSDALSALQGSIVAAYFADSPVAGYYTVQHPDQFELAPIAPLAPAKEGISINKDPKYKDLKAGVLAAFQSMLADGTYKSILTKYGIQDGAISLIP